MMASVLLPAKIAKYFIALSGLLIFSSSCSKSKDETPIAITVSAESIGFSFNNVQTEVSSFSAKFNYEGVEYRISANQVGPADATGTLTISNTNLLAATSTITKLSSSDFEIGQPVAPNSFRVMLNSFPLVFGTNGATAKDVNKFDDITLVLSASTKLYISSSDNGFADEYNGDLEGLTALANTLIAKVNDNDASAPGSQSMALSPHVYQ